MADDLRVISGFEIDNINSRNKAQVLLKKLSAVEKELKDKKECLYRVDIPGGYAITKNPDGYKQAGIKVLKITKL